MFIKNILNISDVKRRFVHDRFGLLREIVRNHLIRLPFQSITAFGSVKVTEKGRPPPTLRNFLGDPMRGVGGMCGPNNYNLRVHLECIGYNVESVTGCFRRTGIPGSHLMTVVKIPPNRQSPEKRYLVDVGCGVPLTEPIPLDELPYRGRAGGLDFRYEWIDDNNLQRVNESGDAIAGQHPKDFLSPQDYTIELTSRTLVEMMPAFHKIFANPKALQALDGVYCFRYLNITDDDFDIVCIRKLELIRITKETRTSQFFANYKELKPKFTEFFPMLDPTEVDRMIEINSNK